MKVNELIAALQAMPPDAELYYALSECQVPSYTHKPDFECISAVLLDEEFLEEKPAVYLLTCEVEADDVLAQRGWRPSGRRRLYCNAAPPGRDPHPLGQDKCPPATPDAP